MHKCEWQFNLFNKYCCNRDFFHRGFKLSRSVHVGDLNAIGLYVRCQGFCN